MPLYVLRGTRCGHTFERYMTIASMERVEKAGMQCPECKVRRKVEVVPSVTGTPIFRPGGVGGFFKTTAKENNDVNG